jgi:hypothetical protein
VYLRTAQSLLTAGGTSCSGEIVLFQRSVETMADFSLGGGYEAFIVAAW